MYVLLCSATVLNILSVLNMNLKAMVIENINKYGMFELMKQPSD